MTKPIVATTEGNVDIYSESLSECIKYTSQFKGTLYQNICDGTSYFVENGFWDYMGLFILVLIGLFFVGLLLQKLTDY